MIYLIIFVFVVFLIFTYIKKNHIHIDYSSIIKEGFKKIDNNFGITCYCGKQGTGKTYSAIKFIEEQKEKFGYTIITNVKSYARLNHAVNLDYYINHKNDQSCIEARYIYEPNIINIIEFCTTFNGNDANILIFFDEIFTVLENQGSIRRDVRSFLSQLRKRSIIFITTAQEWAEIHISFRRYVRYQVSCSMISLPFSHKAWVINEINNGDEIHWDETVQDFVAPIIQTNISKGLKKIIQLYDTFETIDNTELLNKGRG